MSLAGMTTKQFLNRQALTKVVRVGWVKKGLRLRYFKGFLSTMLVTQQFFLTVYNLTMLFIILYDSGPIFQERSKTND